MTLDSATFPKVDDVVLAYLAGVIDSDGYITIQRSTRNDVVYYGPVVGISGTRREPHDLAASIWGGKVGAYTPKNPEHLDQYQWQRMGYWASVAATQVMPYLRIKKRNAELANEIYDHLEFGRSDDPYPWFGPDYDGKNEARRMWEDMVSLNQSRNRLRANKADGREWSEFPRHSLFVDPAKELDRLWPEMPDLEGGIDYFADKHGPPIGKES